MKAAYSRTAIVMVLAAAFAIQPATSQEFPSKPVRIVVPFNAGGGLDILARTLAPPMSRALGQNVLVDNRPGAGTVIGTELVARAPADGYTLLLMANSFTINPAVRSKLPYDTLKDFAAVARLATTPSVFSVHPSVPARTLKELVALARARPGQLMYASGGSGTQQHLASEMLKAAARIDIVHVPYTGGAQAITAVMGGHASILITIITASAPHVASGKLRALAVTSLERAELLKDVPTVAESGFPGYESVTWFGVVAPAATPKPAISRLSSALARAIQQVKDSLDKQGLSPGVMDAEQFAAFVRAELQKNGKVARHAKMRAD
jgi:tripartite-type tricarboxylate transporter receptor subunit TctC